MTTTVILEIFYQELKVIVIHKKHPLSSPKTTPLSSPTWLGIQTFLSFICLKNKYFLDSRFRGNDIFFFLSFSAWLRIHSFLFLSFFCHPRNLLSRIQVIVIPNLIGDPDSFSFNCLKNKYFLDSRFRGNDRRVNCHP